MRRPPFLAMEEHFPYRRIKKPARVKCWLDGKYYFVTDPIFTLADWREAFRAGFWFDVRAYASEVPYFGRYYQYLKDSIAENDYPDVFFLEQETLRKVFGDLLQANHYYGNTILRVTCFLRYIPDVLDVVRAQTSILIEAFPLKGKFFELEPPSGVIATFSRQLFDPKNVLRSRPLVDPYRWQCEVFCRRFTYTDGVYYNIHDRVIQTSLRDLYCIVQGRIETPPIEEGLRYDPFREIVKILARQAGYSFVERPLKQEDVLRAQELFLGSTRYGIEPIRKFDHGYYSTSRTRALISELNRIYFPNHCA